MDLKNLQRVINEALELNEDVYEGLKIYFQEKNINYIDAKVGCTVGIHSGIKPCGIFFFEK